MYILSDSMKLNGADCNEKIFTLMDFPEFSTDITEDFCEPR